MNNEEVKNEIEIDLRGLFSAILNRLTIIILVGILVAGVAFAYTQYFVDPQYVAKTKVYILYKQNDDQQYITSQDLVLATYLAKDYESLLTTEPVLEEVKKELNLEQSTSTIASMISVELEEDTRMMNISVVSTDPKLAKNIADKVREVANEQLKEVMDGMEPIRQVDEAKLPTYPSYPNVEKNTMIGFMIGFGAALMVVVILFILDDTIKTPDDIEKRLGVSVLASIPLKSAESGRTSYGYEYGHKSKKKNRAKEQKNTTKITEKSDSEEKE
jgi:capsular polysaccharide biosynthesis protein